MPETIVMSYEEAHVACFYRSLDEVFLEGFNAGDKPCPYENGEAADAYHQGNERAKETIN